MGWNWALFLLPYGEKFKRYRKYLTGYLKKPLMPKYYPTQLKEVHKMLNDVLDDPANYKYHFKRMSAGIIITTMYGHEVKDRNDHLLTLVDRGVKTAEATGAIGAHIVDLIPCCKSHQSIHLRPHLS